MSAVHLVALEGIRYRKTASILSTSPGICKKILLASVGVEGPAPGFWSCEQTGGFFDCTGVLAHLPSHAQASINTSVSIRYCTVLLFDERKSEIKLSSSFSHAKWSACKSCCCSLSCAPKSCHPNGTQLCTSDIAKRITILPRVGTGPRSCQRKVPK